MRLHLGLAAGTLPERLPLTTHPERALGSQSRGNGYEIQQVVITVGGRKPVCQWGLRFHFTPFFAPDVLCKNCS